MSNLNREPSTDASYHISIHLAKRFHRKKLLRNQPIRNKNCLWRPCLLTDWNEISTLYREHSIDASYQVSVHLVKRFQRRRFKKIVQSEIIVLSHPTKPKVVILELETYLKKNATCHPPPPPKKMLKGGKNE